MSDNPRYNEDELNPPDWLTKEYFEEVLIKKENGNKVVGLDISPATVVGDHFASVMFRAVITYLDDNSNNQQNEITVIVKTMPHIEGFKKETLRESFVFETEIKMYSEAIPKLEKMLRNYGDNTILGAKMLYSSLNPHKVIMFGDLKKEGYATLDKRLCTLEETKMALQKLAKWHASSMKINSEHPGCFTEYNYGVYNMKLENFDFFNQGGETLIELLQTLPDMAIYLPKVNKIKGKLTAKLETTYDVPTKENTKALNHGDFHGKNMMFKFDNNGNATEVMLVDFQLSVWTSIAVDILYGMHMMVQFSVRKNQQDELIYYYFDKLIKTLKIMKYKKELPTMADLKSDMHSLRYLEIFLLATFSPFMHAMQNQDYLADPELLIESEDARKHMYRNPSYIEELRTMIPKFCNEGYFDDFDKM